MGFRRSLIISAVIHACLALAGLIVLPSTTPMTTDPIASIPVDLISDDPSSAGNEKAEKKEISQPKSEPVPAVTPAEKDIINDKPLVDPKTAIAPPPEETAPPPEEKKPEPVAKPPEKPPEQKPEEVDPDGLLKKIEEDKKKEEQQKQEQVKKEQEQKKLEEEKKVAEQKKRDDDKKKADEKKKLADEKKKLEEKRLAQQAEKFDADKISNLLNNQEGSQKAKAEQGEKKDASLGVTKGTGTKLTQSQMGLLIGMIQDQIRPCYSPPPTAQGKDYRISVHIEVNRDGSLNGAPRTTNNNSDPSFSAASSAAERAAVRCSPLKLPAEMYDSWKEIEFSFKANDL